ncbi:MAG: hypothetical protein MRK01_05180 [Candidatus Scalindua sp.]|nr:hypothetical protein [Candidatus Scalindua sp.]
MVRVKKELGKLFCIIGISLFSVCSMTSNPIFADDAKTVVTTGGGPTEVANTEATGDSHWLLDGINTYYNRGNVGIGTSTPEFKFSLDNDGGIIAKGTYDSGTDLKTEGKGARLIWYPKKAAFRAGYVDDNQWDDKQIGIYSVAMGWSTTAIGSFSTAMGSSATASGWASTAIGRWATASGSRSTAIGSATTASGKYSTAMGVKTTAQSSTSFVIGQYNVISGDSSDWVETDPLFVIGNGIDDTKPDNAMTVLKNGNTGIGTTNPAARLDVIGRTRTSSIEITGGSDLSEQFDIGKPHELKDYIKEGEFTIEPGMVASIDTKNPGKLLISHQAYDRTVAGIISGAGGVSPGMLMGQTDSVADGEFPVALTGRVYCKADAKASPIQAGDLLTTSDTPGHVMKVCDHEKAQGAIIGKAMSSLEEGRGLVLVLVSLQ